MKNTFTVVLFWIILLFAFMPKAFSQDPNFHIYLCFGQSNMEGQGDIEAQDQTVNSRFQVMQAVACTGRPQNVWRTATPPIARCNTKLGPSDYFGREMIANLPANVKVGIVHVSIAGSKIEIFDKANYQTYLNSLGANDQYIKNIANEYGGNPYARLVELAKLAQADGVIKGILIHQGESNTGDQAWPTKVRGVYTNLLTDLGLSASNVPLLAGEVVDAAQGGICASMNTIINTLPNTIPTAYIISSSGCTDQTDNLHFNSAGYRLLGIRYAQKMLTLLPAATGAPVVTLTGPTATSFTAPASISFTATATDADGTIANVKFYNGTTLLSTVTASPYTYTWANVAAGSYSLTAVATDNAGGSTTSTAKTVTVTAAGTGTTSCGETGEGAYYTGVYRNMFKELLNKTDTEVDTKVAAAFQQIFYGTATQKLYYEVGTDMAYILDVANNDVRSEGMSYGMMICLQLDKKAEFDKLWRWTKTYMQHTSGNLDGFFRWQMNTNGGVIDNNPAPDGEAYFITALFFAANRWGNGTGIYNYAAEAQAALSKVQSKTGAGGINSLFNTTSKLITFGPNTGSYDYTDPSYNLPGFFELWGRWSTSNTTFWPQTPAASRKLIRDASHPTSGLTADYSNFDGTPKTTTFNTNSHRFMYDAWRTIMNLGMDYHWFKTDPQQPIIAERYLTFFKNQGADYKNHFDWNGANAGGDHSTGLVACNAVASLAVNNPTLTTPFVQEFWNVGVPSGTYRYYDGMLYLLAMLNCSGDFKIWKPVCPNTCATPAPIVPAAIVTYDQNATATQLTATGTSLKWYTVATGGTALTAAPTPITTAVGTTVYYVGQTLNGCEGSRTTVTINVGNPIKELINNGEFDNGTTGWALQNNGGATGTMTGVTNGNLSGTNSLRICPSATPGTLEWHVQVSQTTPIVSGKTYTISFMAKADAARQISVSIQELASPYTTYFTQTVNLTTTAQTFTFTYDATVIDASALIKFYVGADANCVNIDKVSMGESNFQLSATITASGATTFCSGGNVVLNANTGTGYTYQWKNGTTILTGATNASYTATQSGSYTVSITANSQTVTSTATVVTVNAAPAAPTVTSTVAYCQGATASVLTATGTALKWYDVATGGTALANTPTPVTTAVGTINYYVSQTTNGCESTRAQITVTVNALPTATITAASTITFCQGGSVVLTASAGSSYVWKNGTAQVGTAATYSAAATGSYTVEVTNANNCKATSTATVVTVNAAPAAPTVTATVSYCQNATAAQLTATGTTLKWYDVATGGTALANAPTPVTTAVGTINYYVSQTTNGCESARAQIAVTVNALPTATITAASTTTFCQGGSVALTASAGSSYVWKNGTAQVGTASTYSAAATGSYTVEVTNANNCKATSTATVVTVNAAPAAPTVTATTSYCQNATAVQLTATGTALKWYDVITGGTALANTPIPVTATVGTINYYVSQTTNGCESTRAQIAVTVNALPTATITAASTTTFCQGGSVVLTASVGSFYVWKNGTAQVGTAATYSAAATGSYTVEVTNANNCKATSTATVVTVNAAPAAPMVTATTSYCQNATAVQLTATGTALKWYDIATGGTALANTPTPVTTSTGTTNYYVSQTTNGCESARAQIPVTVNALPAATNTAASTTTFCQGGSVVLTASAGSFYVWKNGTAQVGTASTYSAAATGSYTVEVTNANNCKATSTATVVTVNAAPAAPTVTATTSYCQNATAAQLTATGTALKWYDVATGGTDLVNTPTPVTTAVGTINYYVSQTTNGCESTRAQIAVTINALPTATITAASTTTFCQGGSVVLTASAGSSYVWKNGTAQVGTASTYSAAASGSYTVEVTNTNNCKATSTATVVTVNAAPAAPTVTATTSYCQNATAAQLTATGTALKWYDIATGGTALANTPTPVTTAVGTINYYVSQTTNGCESTRAQIAVTVNALPAATITPTGSTTIPSGGSVTLNANTGSGLTHKWFNGSTQVGTGVSYIANTVGSYVVEVTNASGCKAISLATDVNAASNQPSVITITSPTANETIVGAITITVNVSDPDGNITLVEYLDGNTVIGSSTTQPFSFDWTNPGTGSHVITVRVTDSNGGITTSAPVTITNSATTTGVTHATTISATVYPNPSNGDVYIETVMDLSNATFTVIDVLGKELFLSSSVNANGARVDVSGLAEGAYIIVITEGTSVIRKKITVIK